MLQRETTGANLVDVLDRVVDKGIVVDAWIALAMAGLSNHARVARIVVASVETHLQKAEPAAPGNRQRRPETVES